MSNKILVIGATGNVGSNLVNFLAEKGEQVRAATRHPDDYPDLANVEAVEFDYDRPETYGPALEGVDRVYVIARNADAHADKVIIPFIDQAEAAGVDHIVLMTAMGVDQAPKEVPYRKIELHLMDAGVDYTILRPNWFMQNFNPGFFLPMIKQNGGIFLPVGDAKTSLIDVRDIAAVAAVVFTEDGHKGKEYALTGGEALSYQEAADIVSEVSGRKIKYVPISDDDLRGAFKQMGFNPEQTEMMVGLFQTVRQGWTAAVTPTVSNLLGREPITFEQFARENADAWK